MSCKALYAIQYNCIQLLDASLWTTKLENRSVIFLKTDLKCLLAAGNVCCVISHVYSVIVHVLCHLSCKDHLLQTNGNNPNRKFALCMQLRALSIAYRGGRICRSAVQSAYNVSLVTWQKISRTSYYKLVLSMLQIFTYFSWKKNKKKRLFLLHFSFSKHNYLKVLRTVVSMSGSGYHV